VPTSLTKRALPTMQSYVLVTSIQHLLICQTPNRTPVPYMATGTAGTKASLVRLEDGMPPAFFRNKRSRAGISRWVLLRLAVTRLTRARAMVEACLPFDLAAAGQRRFNPFRPGLPCLSAARAKRARPAQSGSSLFVNGVTPGGRFRGPEGITGYPLPTFGEWMIAERSDCVARGLPGTEPAKRSSQRRARGELTGETLPYFAALRALFSPARCP
jgi:hypothetical protein